MGYTFTQFVPYTLKRDYGDDYVTRFFKFEDCEKLKKAPFEGEIVGSFILNKKQYGFIRTTIKDLVHKFFCCFIPMKISHKLCVRMGGTQFLLL